MLQHRLRLFFFLLCVLIFVCFHENNCCKMLLLFRGSNCAGRRSSNTSTNVPKVSNVATIGGCPGKLSPRFTTIRAEKWCEEKGVLMSAFRFSLSPYLACSSLFGERFVHVCFLPNANWVFNFILFFSCFNHYYLNFSILQSAHHFQR